MQRKSLFEINEEKIHKPIDATGKAGHKLFLQMKKSCHVFALCSALFHLRFNISVISCPQRRQVHGLCGILSFSWFHSIHDNTQVDHPHHSFSCGSRVRTTPENCFSWPYPAAAVLQGSRKLSWQDTLG